MLLTARVQLLIGSIAEDLGAAVFLIGVCIASLVFWVTQVKETLELRQQGSHATRWGLRERRARRRAHQAELAAAAAALESEWFAPEVIHAAADQLIEVAEAVWQRHRSPHPGRADTPPITRWAKAVTSWIGDTPHLRSAPTVQILRIINRAGQLEDRAILRVRLHFRASQREIGFHLGSWLDLRWTLGRRDGEWILLAVGADPLVDDVLRGDLITGAFEDSGRVRESSLIELASVVGHQPNLGELVSTDSPLRVQMLELAQIDGRFDPDLVDARIRHILEAWEEASTGASAPLAGVASRHVMYALLRPGGGHAERRVLRDAVLERWEPQALDLAGSDPQITVALTISAVAYVVGSDGERRAGTTGRRALDLRWTLASADPREGWRLVESAQL